MATHYASADLFVFPSLTETFGNVTTEAMASGLPVVVFDCAAAAQVIADGEQGVCVPFGDASAFVEASLELAFDPARRERLGRAARERALQLDWGANVQRFESVLASATRPAEARAGLAPAEPLRRPV